MPRIEIPEGMNEDDVRRILEAAQKKKDRPAGEDYVEFARFESGHEQEIRVYRDIFKGRELLSIRRFYLDPVEGYKPGKGVTFHDEDVDEVIAGLEKMNEWLAEDPTGKHTKQGDD